MTPPPERIVTRHGFYTLLCYEADRYEPWRFTIWLDTPAGLTEEEQLKFLRSSKSVAEGSARWRFTAKWKAKKMTKTVADIYRRAGKQ